MSRLRVATAATIVVLAAAPLTGCSEGRREEVPSSTSSRRVDTSEMWSLFGPIDTFLYEGSDPARSELGVRRAIAEAVTDCMAGRGWSYRPDPTDEAQVRRDLITNATGSTLGDERFRTVWGYGLTRSLLDQAAPVEGESSNSKYYASLPAGEQDTYDRELNDCLASANEKVGLADADWHEFGRLQENLLSQITADADLSGAAEAWKACMAAKGYQANSIVTAPATFEQEVRALYDRPDPPAAAVEVLHQREITQAADDWACQKDTTVKAWVTARDKVESAFVEDHVELLTSLRGSLSKAARGG